MNPTLIIIIMNKSSLIINIIERLLSDLVDIGDTETSFINKIKVL